MNNWEVNQAIVLAQYAEKVKPTEPTWEELERYYDEVWRKGHELGLRKVPILLFTNPLEGLYPREVLFDFALSLGGR